MHIRCFNFCWALLAGVIQAAENPEAVAEPAPSGNASSLPALRPEPALRPAIEKALEQSVQNGYLLHDTTDKTLLQVSLQIIDRPPADMAFEVSLRSGERTWPLGPMAWKKDEIGGWAYDVDLPEATQVDIVFTPSARAGMLLSRFPVWPIKGLTSVWSGEPIVVSGVDKIRSQDISMLKLRTPGDEEAREHLVDALTPDRGRQQRLDDGISLDELRTLLEGLAAAPNSGAEAQFNLGCVMVAQGKLDEAMTPLLKARGVAYLEGRLRRELRYICARWLDAADKGGVPEMFFLGRAYEEGHGVGQDAQQAKYWYRKAANAGHAESKTRLVAMKSTTPDVSDSAAKALDAYRVQAATWHAKSTTTYQEWVERYVHKSFQAVDFDGKTSGLKVVITTLEGENDKGQDDNFESAQTRHETELLDNGRIRNTRYSSRGTSGGSGSNSPVPADTLAHIDVLIDHLPNDHGILPPVNRRLLIETANKPEHQVRVYDLADVPPEVEELTHLLCAPAYVPRFQPFSSIHVRGFEFDGDLVISPQNEILYMGREHRLQWWDPTTHEFLAEADIGHVKEIVIAPDKIHALVQTYSDVVLVDLPERKPLRTFKDRSRPQFTQDGKQALLYAREAPVEILDTQSWLPVGQADDVPADCTSFIPAPSIHRALVRSSDGSVSLWDTAAHRAITQLGSESELNLFAEFSPDESLVAVCAHPWNPNGKDLTPVVIYRSDDGTKVRGMRSLHDSFQSLLWTSDGHYVLVASGNSGGTTTVSIFNTANGKCCGVLTGPSRINGIGLFSKSGELVAGDQNGTIWFWDLPVVMDRIREFEASLTAPEK